VRLHLMFLLDVILYKFCIFTTNTELESANLGPHKVIVSTITKFYSVSDSNSGSNSGGVSSGGIDNGTKVAIKVEEGQSATNSPVFYLSGNGTGLFINIIEIYCLHHRLTILKVEIGMSRE
jgi:hypothetical protein